MSNRKIKILFTKSTTINTSRKKISLAQGIVDTAKVENGEYFKKVTEALKHVPYEEIKTKSMSY